MNQEKNVNSEQCEVDREKRAVDSKKPEEYFFRASAQDFKKIPGSPIAYWVSENIKSVFKSSLTFDDEFKIKAGICTGKNEVYILNWQEVEFSDIRRNDSDTSRYTPHNKGGEYRKWYGNLEAVLKYSKKHLEQMSINPGFRHDGKEYYFLEHIGWSKITSSKSSFRKYPSGCTFDSAGLGLFSSKKYKLSSAVSFLNSNISSYIISLLNPTLNVTPQILKKIPFVNAPRQVLQNTEHLELQEKYDWDAYERSWDFTTLPLLHSNYRFQTLEESYAALSNHWKEMTLEMQRLEEENNRIFIEAYGLQDELTPEVPLNEITLTCNPYYRYGGNKTEEALEALLLADTMKEFISYAVGCMMGRYSLDQPGLILANAGETLEDYFKQVPEPSFMPDDDNIIPLMDVDWFEDDIAERFKTFLRVTFGDSTYTKNLLFIEEALGKDVRKYFLKDFYTDHVKTYKKRPIYWMFSSKKGTFNALVYLHRYRPETINDLLNEYVREFGKKLTAHRDNKMQESITAEGRTKVALEKEITKLNKQIEELNEYERDLFTFASQPAEALVLDLDDGVKVNYKRFSPVLKKVTGLS